MLNLSTFIMLTHNLTIKKFIFTHDFVPSSQIYSFQKKNKIIYPMKQFPTDKSSTDFDRLKAQYFITLHVKINGADQCSLTLSCTLLAGKWRGPTHPPNESLCGDLKTAGSAHPK